MVICASVERDCKCLRPRPQSSVRRSHSFFCVASRIAGWLISGVAKRHQPAASTSPRPSLVSALIGVLSSASHTCSAPLPSPNREKSVRRGRLAGGRGAGLSFLPPQTAISKLVTWQLAQRRASLSPISIPFCSFKLLSRQWATIYSSTRRFVPHSLICSPLLRWPRARTANGQVADRRTWRRRPQKSFLSIEPIS